MELTTSSCNCWVMSTSVDHHPEEEVVEQKRELTEVRHLVFEDAAGRGDTLLLCGVVWGGGKDYWYGVTDYFNLIADATLSWPNTRRTACADCARHYKQLLPEYRDKLRQNT